MARGDPAVPRAARTSSTGLGPVRRAPAARQAGARACPSGPSCRRESVRSRPFCDRLWVSTFEGAECLLGPSPAVCMPPRPGPHLKVRALAVNRPAGRRQDPRGPRPVRQARMRPIRRGMRHVRAGDKILGSIREARHPARRESGELIVHVPPEFDVKALRRKLGMSQSRFAASFGFGLAAVQSWEQGRRRPEAPARVLLKVIDHEPRRQPCRSGRIAADGPAAAHSPRPFITVGAPSA